MILYNELELQSNINKRKKDIVLIIIFSALIVLTLLVTAFFINDNTIILIKAINYTVGILSGWFVIGVIIFSLIPLKKRYTHIYNIINCEKLTITGKFVGNGNDYTLQNRVKSREVKIDTFERHYTLYLNIDNEEIPEFIIDNYYKLQIVNNFIYSVEDYESEGVNNE